MSSLRVMSSLRDTVRVEDAKVECSGVEACLSPRKAGRRRSRGPGALLAALEIALELNMVLGRRDEMGENRRADTVCCWGGDKAWGITLEGNSRRFSQSLGAEEWGSDLCGCGRSVCIVRSRCPSRGPVKG